ncbi:MAG: hypothetical protein ISN29_12495 [Gammaproteobacteria bacterium AqS3]|nr:hypothetical protein [Gammaproteobacteria bacterium AqS3]
MLDKRPIWVLDVVWVVIWSGIFGWMAYVGTSPSWIDVLGGVVLGASMVSLLNQYAAPGFEKLGGYFKKLDDYFEGLDSYFERQEDEWKAARRLVEQGGVMPADYWYYVPKKERPEQFRNIKLKELEELKKQEWRAAKRLVEQGGAMPADYWDTVPKKQRPEGYRHLRYKWWKKP